MWRKQWCWTILRNNPPKYCRNTGNSYRPFHKCAVLRNCSSGPLPWKITNLTSFGLVAGATPDSSGASRTFPCRSGLRKPMTARAMTAFSLFSPPGNRAISNTFWGGFLTKDKTTQNNWRKGIWRNSTKSGAQKLQISVPYGGRLRPESKNVFKDAFSFVCLLQQKIKEGEIIFSFGCWAPPNVGLAPSAAWRPLPLHPLDGRPLPEHRSKSLMGWGEEEEGEEGRAVTSGKGPPPVSCKGGMGWGPECTKPSHSQSLANFVGNFHSQGNYTAARTRLSQFHSQNHSHSLANSFATLKLKFEAFSLRFGGKIKIW